MSDSACDGLVATAHIPRTEPFVGVGQIMYPVQANSVHMVLREHCSLCVDFSISGSILELISQLRNGHRPHFASCVR